MPTLRRTESRFVLAIVAFMAVVVTLGSALPARPEVLEVPRPWPVPPIRPSMGIDRFAVDFIGRLGHDYSTQLRFPFRYARQRPGRFLLGTAGVLTLIVTDQWTYEALAPRAGQAENALVDPAARLSKWGGAHSAIPLVFGIGALGLLTDSRRERQTSVMLLEALVSSATWTGVLKELSGRERPRAREGSVAEWEGPSFLADDYEAGDGLRSFPSGHATGIWAAATILAHQYPAHRIVPVLAYGTATAMSYSRMVVGAHWLSDVVVGGLIGYGSARQVLSAHNSEYPAADTGGLALGMNVSGDYKGFTLRYDF
ncbi:MAG: phosphatase PAP2 family protein [Candidatus Krumholzibacteriia bacterium]